MQSLVWQALNLHWRCMMSDHLPRSRALLAQFKEHLAKGSYSASAARRYVAVAGHFLRYIGKRHIQIEEVQPLQVSMYLRRELRRFSRLHGRAPRSIDQWR